MVANRFLDTQCCNTLIGAFMRCDPPNLARGLEIVQLMSSAGLRPDAYTLSLLYGGCLGLMRSAARGVGSPCPPAAVEEAEDIIAELDRIVRNGEVRPNAAVFTQRIMYHGLKRDIVAAEKEVDAMIASGVPPDARVFNTLLRQCLDYAPARFGQVLAALDATGLAWDDYTFAMVAEHRARAGNVDGCVATLDAMLKRGLLPTDANVGVVVQALTSTGQVQRAWKLLRRMVEAGVACGPDPINMLLSRWENPDTAGGKAAGLQAYAEELAAGGGRWNALTYSILMRAWHAEEEWGRVWSLFCQLVAAKPQAGGARGGRAGQQQSAVRGVTGRACAQALEALKNVQAAHTAQGGPPSAAPLPSRVEDVDNTVDGLFWLLQVSA